MGSFGRVCQLRGADARGRLHTLAGAYEKGDRGYTKARIGLLPDDDGPGEP